MLCSNKDKVDTLGFCEIIWMILACWSTSNPHINSTSPFVSVPLTGLLPSSRCQECIQMKILLLQSTVSFVWCLKTAAETTPAAACASILCVSQLPSPPQQQLRLRPTGRRCQDALESISFSHFNYS